MTSESSAPIYRPDLASRIAESQRGSCPSLARPMQTGDGLIIRLRARSGVYSLLQLAAMAASARRLGNGLLEVSARGNLQIRGLSEATVGALPGDVGAAGIDPAIGIAIECPPLAGLDRQAALDPRPFAESIRETLASLGLTLSAKFSLTVEAGEAIGLGAIACDIKIRSFAGPEGPVHAIRIGGTASTGRLLGVFDSAACLAAIATVARAVAALGPRARARDLATDALDLPPSLTLALPQWSDAEPQVIGRHDLGDGHFALGMQLAFGQISAETLLALCDRAGGCGASDVRLAPGHSMLFTGLDAAGAEELSNAGHAPGLILQPHDPRALVDLCAGARGCASGFFDTHQLAEKMMAEVPALFDGSLRLHVSGCPKGCAHPGPRDLTLTSAPFGYGLVVNGCASDSPAAYIAASDIAIALNRLAELLAREKGTGETARDCLMRLQPQIAAGGLELE